MTRWRRRIGLAAAVVLGVALVRTGLALRPPARPAWPEWETIAGVTVINPGHDRRADQTIVMRGGRIESIRDRDPAIVLRARARLFEQRYVLPGLIDKDVRTLPSSIHLQRLFGLLFLSTGVTTVRDLGSFDGSLAALQQQIAAGAMPWPRLIACGRVLEGDPPLCPTSRVVRDADDVRRAVDELAAQGAACVAVGRTLAPELLPALRAAAATKGFPLAGDLPAAAPIGAAAFDARLLSALPPPPPGRRLADLIRGWHAVDSAGIDALVAASASHAATYSTGLVRWSQLAQLLGSTHEQDPLTALLPRFYRDVIWRREVETLLAPPIDGGVGVTAQTITEAVAAMRQAVGRLHGAGVRITLGTGAPSPSVVPGFSVWFELQNLVFAGLTPEEAWAAATRAAGESLGIPQLGTLADGAPADLLIFRDDPTRDLAALSSLEAVVSQGRLYGARRLNGYALEYARYVQGTAYDWLSMLWVRLRTWWAGEQDAACPA
jgi:imidazolonepropionase-like amidohydrolase